MWVLLLVSVAGFLAQLVDGAMGMAFGITSTTLLIFLAYNPAAASAIVHLVEIVTSSISGASHIKFGNVDWHALVKVAVPGAIGAFVGAMLLSNIDLSAARPWTATVLLVLGALVLYRFTRSMILGKKRRARARWLAPLGLVGGFSDSTGGGGWGNQEKQFYTNRPENLRIEDGVLVIEGKKEVYQSNNYTSARINTKGKASFKYGRIEVADIDRYCKFVTI
jgi:uncharacterized membrane protein YfcA